MSRLRLTKITSPSTPPASTGEIYYDTAGAGYGTPAGLAVKDENGVIAMLGHFTALDYRLLSVVIFVSGTTYTPTNGTRAILVECQGGGGGGGGCATAATNSAAAGGGSGGAYAVGWITGITTTKAMVIGLGGAGGVAGANNGSVGADTTFDVTTVVAKGGLGGIADTVAVGPRIGGLGAAGIGSGSSTGNVGKTMSQAGTAGIVLAAAQAVSGDGGGGYMGMGKGQGIKTQGAGSNGGNYGGGGAGGCILSGGASVAGGNGGQGFIRVWEFA